MKKSALGICLLGLSIEAQAHEINWSDSDDPNNQKAPFVTPLQELPIEEEQPVQQDPFDPRGLQEEHLQERPLQQRRIPNHSLEENRIKSRPLEEESIPDNGLQEQPLQELPLQENRVN